MPIQNSITANDFSSSFVKTTYEFKIMFSQDQIHLGNFNLIDQK